MPTLYDQIRIYFENGTDSLCEFTANELSLFEKHEEGYDLKDSRYNDWLKEYHPSSPAAQSKPSEVQYLEHQTVFYRFLHTKQPSIQVPSVSTKHCDRVLTNLKRIEQKEKQKAREGDPETITSMYVCTHTQYTYMYMKIYMYLQCM